MKMSAGAPESSWRASAELARTNPAAEGGYHEADIAFHRAVVNATENLAFITS